jgi:hypothetical protein
MDLSPGMASFSYRLHLHEQTFFRAYAIKEFSKNEAEYSSYIMPPFHLVFF